MSDRVAEAVFAALARQLGRSVADIRAAADQGLDVLGLDSHGLLRVLLDIEQQLGLKDLDLPDDALVSPATMVTGVTAQV
jgi:acyl carrier protein